MAVECIGRCFIWEGNYSDEPACIVHACNIVGIICYTYEQIVVLSNEA